MIDKKYVKIIQNFMIDYPNQYERQEKDVDYYRKVVETLQCYVQNLKNELFDAKAGGDIIKQLQADKASLTQEIETKKLEVDEWHRKYNELVDEQTIRTQSEAAGVEGAVAQYKQLVATYQKMYREAVAELDKKS